MERGLAGRTDPYNGGTDTTQNIPITYSPEVQSYNAKTFWDGGRNHNGIWEEFVQIPACAISWHNAAGKTVAAGRRVSAGHQLFLLVRAVWIAVPPSTAAV